MSAAEWDQRHAEVFQGVWSALNRVKLLKPSKLQWLDDDELEAALAAALLEDPTNETDEDINEALTKWLRGERDAARRIQLSEGPVSLRDWQRDSYAFSLLRDKRKRARLQEEAAANYSGRNFVSGIAAAASTGAASTATRNRSNLCDREDKEERERRLWARRAVEVLMKNGWLDQAAMEMEQENARIETRLLRGLRMRTIRQRVQSIERIQRWALNSLGKPWPANVNELEDYMEDLAADPKRGASSFARAKFGIIYAEAAANVPMENRLGDAPA